MLLFFWCIFPCLFLPFSILWSSSSLFYFFSVGYEGKTRRCLVKPHIQWQDPRPDSELSRFNRHNKIKETEHIMMITCSEHTHTEELGTYHQASQCYGCKSTFLFQTPSLTTAIKALNQISSQKKVYYLSACCAILSTKRLT